MSLNFRIVNICVLAFILMVACSPPPVPKPRSFFRIDMPEKEYLKFENGFPYSFEYPAYASVVSDPSPAAEPWWINIEIPRFKARIHLSYKNVDDNLHEYLDDTHKLLTKHISKASGIREDIITNEEEDVYGIIYNIRGTGVASTCQFYLTDSTRHFLRGALYFNVVPNNDSLAPVIEFLKEDIQHMAMTLKWKPE
jgi:gliding motility-associated lipoprotein GldD